MKKLLISLAAIAFFSPDIFSQDYIRPAELGVSFNLYDVVTAQRIRSTSLSSVLANHRWAKIGQMLPGIRVHYFKGLKEDSLWIDKFEDKHPNKIGHEIIANGVMDYLMKEKLVPLDQT